MNFRVGWGVPVPWIQKPGINVTSETPMLPILRMYLQLECHMQYNTSNKVAKPGLPPFIYYSLSRAGVKLAGCVVNFRLSAASSFGGGGEIGLNSFSLVQILPVACVKMKERFLFSGNGEIKSSWTRDTCTYVLLCSATLRRDPDPVRQPIAFPTGKHVGKEDFLFCSI